MQTVISTPFLCVYMWLLTNILCIALFYRLSLQTSFPITQHLHDFSFNLTSSFLYPRSFISRQQLCIIKLIAWAQLLATQPSLIADLYSFLNAWPIFLRTCIIKYSSLKVVQEEVNVPKYRVFTFLNLLFLLSKPLCPWNHCNTCDTSYTFFSTCSP